MRKCPNCEKDLVLVNSMVQCGCEYYQNIREGTKGYKYSVIEAAILKTLNGYLLSCPGMEWLQEWNKHFSPEIPITDENAIIKTDGAVSVLGIFNSLVCKLLGSGRILAVCMDRTNRDQYGDRVRILTFAINDTVESLKVDSNYKGDEK